MTAARILAVAIDCRQPDLLAEFWAAALGNAKTRTWTDSHGLTYRQVDFPDGPALLFQPVPEGNCYEQVTGNTRVTSEYLHAGPDDRALGISDDQL
ncbi:VOC family protein [Amycolatopsis mediterranei]|uniref:VOC family protein n=1 Tax=Amycolatopsis mediterranei TaxID=33910 RepID=UPI0034494958